LRRSCFVSLRSRCNAFLISSAFLNIVCFSQHRLLFFILEFPWCYRIFAIHVVAQAAVDRARRSLDEEERRWAYTEFVTCRMFAFTIVTTNIAAGLPAHRPCATCCRCCAGVCLCSSLILIDY
jgi:hypothetical protein